MVGRVSVGQAVYQRNYQRARARALVRLSRLFQEEYKQLLQEERANDEAMGKTWVGIDIGTGIPITIGSHSDFTSEVTPTGSNYEGANAGNDGGEA